MNLRRKVKTLNEDCRWSMPSCPSSPNQHHRPVFALRAPICPISQLSSQQMLLIEPWSRLPQDAVFERIDHVARHQRGKTIGGNVAAKSAFVPVFRQILSQFNHAAEKALPLADTPWLSFDQCFSPFQQCLHRVAFHAPTIFEPNSLIESRKKGNIVVGNHIHGTLALSKNGEDGRHLCPWRTGK